MKNYLLFCVLVALPVTLSLTNCTKESAQSPTEQTTLDFQTAIIGSWQTIAKGVEIEMHDQRACSQMGDNTTSAKTTTVVQWENTAGDEKRNFKQNGDFSQYSEFATCQGAYKISENGILEVNTNCKNGIEKIEELTSTFLTVRNGHTFFKYRKVN